MTIWTDGGEKSLTAPISDDCAAGILANMRRQMADSLVDAPFPMLPASLQNRTFWEFGSAEDHFKYRDAVMEAWPRGNFPVFEGHNHMQFQIDDPKGFAAMLSHIIETNELPELPFCRS